MKLNDEQKLSLAAVDQFVGGLVVCAIAKRWQVLGKEIRDGQSHDEFALDVFEALGIPT